MNSAVTKGVAGVVYLGLGIEPDWVRLTNIDSTSTESIYWNKKMRSLTCIEGIQITGADGTTDELGYGEGVIPYKGCDIVDQDVGTTEYKVWDPEPDKRSANVANGYAAIKTWTLGSSANRTGNWNDEANTTYVGVGSVIKVKQSVDGEEVEAVVLAITSNGEAANEVTLNKAVKTGTILRLSGMTDFINAIDGVTMPAGIKINETSAINESGERLLVEWGINEPQPI